MITIKQLTFTGINGSRAMTPGVYVDSLFTKEEIDFMLNLGSAEQSTPEPKKVKTIIPSKQEGEN